KNKTYRAFEIQGDSMLPLQPGSIIFGEYVENIGAVKNGKLYILVTKQDGIVFKRVFNFGETDGKFLLVSDNRQYEPYSVDATDGLELWSARAFFSHQFPDVQAGSVSMDHLAHTVLELQSEVKRLKKKA